jgi:Cu-Zn family superoxide dismutase
MVAQQGTLEPTFKKITENGVAEYHKGDIGNFTADANGNGTISLTTDEWNIGSGDPMKDILGKGLIVHQGTDDFTQPSGNAGVR